ncbi:uncharacterized protein N0V89_000627 [Didymosphaeria variabile]|uniref:Major facilitator superfamily (MFS) profile domain-containing protein n=1 Tax=Didymosphaeria variabile TaxID=1932322 RepID=A0A9W8XVK0_9PLEO|nr:uncharacterized protein N0V89_000627 [Didymosphaeria variabile]KAJ4360068.1 hypothetical protein N0V89_000627 [Didymosphaeria variabile]
MFHRFAVSGLTGIFGQVSGNGDTTGNVAKLSDRLITYYFAKVLRIIGVTSNRTIQRIILSHNCWALINSVPLSLIAPRYPRRHMFVLGALGMAACFTAWTIASARYAITGSEAAAATSIAFIFLYNPFLNVGLNSLAYTYIVELFPFTQRSQGLAFKQLVGRLGNFFNAYVNPIAIDAIGWKYYILYCVWLLVEAWIVWVCFPETHGRTLEDLSFMLEAKGSEIDGDEEDGNGGEGRWERGHRCGEILRVCVSASAASPLR